MGGQLPECVRFCPAWAGRAARRGRFRSHSPNHAKIAPKLMTCRRRSTDKSLLSSRGLPGGNACGADANAERKRNPLCYEMQRARLASCPSVFASALRPDPQTQTWSSRWSPPVRIRYTRIAGALNSEDRRPATKSTCFSLGGPLASRRAEVAPLRAFPGLRSMNVSTAFDPSSTAGRLRGLVYQRTEDRGQKTEEERRQNGCHERSNRHKSVLSLQSSVL